MFDVSIDKNRTTEPSDTHHMANVGWVVCFVGIAGTPLPIDGVTQNRPVHEGNRGLF